MSKFLSNELTTLNSGQDMGAVVQHAKFSFTAPVGGLAVGDTVDLCSLGENSKLLGLTATASVAIAIGDGAVSNIYTQATTFSDTTIQAVQDAVKSARLAGAEKRLIATVKATMAEADTIEGAITFVKGA